MKNSLNVQIATSYGTPGNEKKTRAIDLLQKSVCFLYLFYPFVHTNVLIQRKFNNNVL